MSALLHRAARAMVTLAWVGLVSLLLAGCAARPRANIAPPPPRIVTVDRVVAETCLKPGDVPPPPAAAGPQINGDAIHDTQVLAAALLTEKAWAGRAIALLGACTAPDVPAPDHGPDHSNGSQ